MPLEIRPQTMDLKTSDLYLGYGSSPVIDGLNFVVPAGKITAIIGANGSGKSTLLRGLSRVLKPTSGSVLLNGRDIHEIESKGDRGTTSTLEVQQQALCARIQNGLSGKQLATEEPTDTKTAQDN